MHRSHIPAHKWLYAMYCLVTARKGVSSLQLSKELGIRQASAWFLLQRIRGACSSGDPLLGHVVEIGETHIGGKEKNKHEHRKLNAGRGTVGKQAVVGMRESGGEGPGFPRFKIPPARHCMRKPMPACKAARWCAPMISEPILGWMPPISIEPSAITSKSL